MASGHASPRWSLSRLQRLHRCATLLAAANDCSLLEPSLGPLRPMQAQAQDDPGAANGTSARLPSLLETANGGRHQAPDHVTGQSLLPNGQFLWTTDASCLQALLEWVRLHTWDPVLSCSSTLIPLMALASSGPAKRFALVAERGPVTTSIEAYERQDELDRLARNQSLRRNQVTFSRSTSRSPFIGISLVLFDG